ncbi:MAG: DUF4926 domain-containing protein [Candidatus Lambdaproteobacteria bacterium]|nr:DUF4926 domain-containing protein [Candidatus Lambdaproteobacteria bacterium]
MIREHDTVVLACDVPDERLKEGDVGTVVHVYRNDAAYEVEFMTLDGQTVAIVTLEKHQVRPVGRDDIHHARPLETTP